MALNADALTSVENARDWIGDPNAKQEKLELLINDASRAVRVYVKRQFMPLETDVAKTFYYSGNGYLALTPTELKTVTGIVLFSDMPATNRITLQAAGSGNEADWRLEPRQGTLESTYLDIVLPDVPLHPTAASLSGYPPSQSMKGCEVKITGNWGAGTTPGDVEAATLIAVEAAYRNSASFASRTVGASSFSEFTPTSVGEGGALPHGSLSRLARYRRDRYL